MFLGFVRIKLSDREQLWSNSNGLKFLFEIGTISDGAMLGIPDQDILACPGPLFNSAGFEGRVGGR